MNDDQEPPNTSGADDAESPEVDTRAGWRALIALVCGFFMILLDATIVSVAMPAIMDGLDADTGAVVWVTSAYLLAFAVPLLITGRLGDRFGPKRIYLTGLTLFTIASVICGFAPTIGVLICARALQGLGASMISPQSMAVITRLFPPRKRGAAMGVWGAVGGIATFSGPLVGGLLVDTVGWEWIFRINLPIGIAAFIAAVRLVPTLPQASHHFDLIGVGLSAVGRFCLVFGLEEGHRYGWGQIVGPISVPLLLVVGAVVMTVFVWWQTRTSEPLVPLALFGDRDFSAANIGIMMMGGIVNTINIPLMFYLQTGRGISPFMSALVLMPSAVVGGVLAPFVGRYVDRTHPRHVAIAGFVVLSTGLAWTAAMMRPGFSPWWLFASSTLLGMANSLIWSPLSVSATRNLPQHRAGAGSGVYNMTRQFGAVLVMAITATLMAARLDARVGGDPTQSPGPATAEELAGYALAMGDTVWFPAVLGLIGVGAAVTLQRATTSENRLR